MAKVLLSEGEEIVTAIKRLAKMLSGEGILGRVKNAFFQGYMTLSQKKRNKKKASAVRTKKAEVKIRTICQRLGIELDPDIKPSNDAGQNNDTNWATGEDSWSPVLSKPLFIPLPPESEFSWTKKHAGPARRFGFGERFRRTATKTEVETGPTTHVCGIAEYKFRKQAGFILVRGLNDDGTERTRFAFPGGGLEAGETPEQAVVREYLEETNLKVKVIGKIFSQVADSHTFMAYWVKIVDGSPKMGEEIVEMRLMTPDFLRDFIKNDGVSKNHIKTFEAFEQLQEHLATQEAIQKARQAKRQEVARNLAKLAAENKNNHRGRFILPPQWVEINKTRRPQPTAPTDQTKGGSMYKLTAEMADLKKLGIAVSVQLQNGKLCDKWDLLASAQPHIIKPEADGCIMKNGRNDRFALMVSFPADLKGTRLIAALQSGERGENLQQIVARPLTDEKQLRDVNLIPAGEDRSAVVKLISTYEVYGGNSTKFPENNLLLILVKKEQLAVYRIGIATRIYDAKCGGAHQFLVVQKAYQSQLYQNTKEEVVTDDEFPGFNRWADMQTIVGRMVNTKALAILANSNGKTRKTASKKVAENQAVVIFFDILKGFGMAETKDGPRYFHWLQTDSNDRLPYFEKGQLVNFTNTYQSINGIQLTGVSAVDG